MGYPGILWVYISNHGILYDFKMNKIRDTRIYLVDIFVYREIIRDSFEYITGYTGIFRGFISMRF